MGISMRNTPRRYPQAARARRTVVNVKPMRGLAWLLCAVFVAGSACARDYGKNDFHVEGDTLKRGPDAFTLRAFLVPHLAAPETSVEEIAQTLTRIAEVGGTAICVDLWGFEDGGRRVPDATIEAIKTRTKEWRDCHMSTIVRLPGDAIPNDAASRKEAVKAAAVAFKDEATAVYWIDGPDSEALTAEFRAIAPDVAVASPAGGQILAVTSPDAVPAGQPALLIGAPPKDVQSRVNTLLPFDDAHLAALDKALAYSEESAPVTYDNSILTEEERNEGWIALFDGKTFNGWVITGNKDAWTIQDGVIQWVAKGGNIVRSVERFDNFVLRLEARINDGGNSGVFLRAPRGARSSRFGMEFQIMGDHGKEPTKTSTGAVYDVLPPLLNAGKPADQWNEIEIILDGSHLKATLNGKVVQDVNVEEDEKLRHRLRRGFIGLQDHGNPAAFRNIRIKRL